MIKMEDTRITMTGEEFKPAMQLKKLYFIYFLLVMFFGVLAWYVPILVINVSFLILLILSLPIIAILVFMVYWISKYYDSISYKLTEDEIVWRRGVWFKNTGIVPYNKITNVDIGQGPISRKLGIASLKIQTAGYSGQKMSAEIKLEGIVRFEELRELIMEHVRGKRPLAVENFGGDPSERMLAELVTIRSLLERILKK